MKKFRSKLENNKRAINQFFTKLIGSVFSIFGVMATCIDFTKYFPHWYTALLYILIIVIIVYLISTAIVLNLNSKIVFSNKNQKNITVKYGDLFSDNTSIKVIPVNKCFDTEVNEDLISRNSLHGKLIKRELKNIGIDEFREQIEESLSAQNLVGVNVEDKKKGKQLRYPVGTVAEVKDGDITYYLLGLTEMDTELKSHCKIEEYCIAIIELMNYFDKRGQGEDMAMPIMGAGFSRMNRSEKELLECMIALVKAQQSKMRGNVDIVIHEELKSELSIATIV